MHGRATVLLIDSDLQLARELAHGLALYGFVTEHAESGARGMAAAQRDASSIDVVLLSSTLSDALSGEVLGKLRMLPGLAATPVMIATGADHTAERIAALELGADACVTKPYKAREIALRTRALLRWTQPVEARPAQAAVAQRGLRIDLQAHLVWVDGEEISLTALEFRLLHVLASRRGRVQSRARLLEDVWAMNAELTTRTVDTHVRRLRGKLGSAASRVETVRGVGYRFDHKSSQDDVYLS